MKEQLAIAWINLTLSVYSLIPKEKFILNKISGGFHFKSINALMGSSGSGKTTLLKCLNGSNKYCLTKGSQIFLNSKQKINSCFIYQDQSERLLKGLTVRQTLSYSSKLKNSSEKIEVNHQNNINDLMNELLMSEIADNLVENCSGGQLKRLSIALELTSHKKPNILCIDEPTTGLDSNAAEVVIKCLKVLSRKYGMSIITSIHQPNNDLFMMFDNIYVLAKGGVSVYSGQPKDLKTHLNECNIICNEFEVPIEVLLKISSKGMSNSEVIVLSERTSQLKQILMKRCNKETTLTSGGIQLKPKMFNLIDFWHLLLRTMTYTYISQWKSLLTQLIFYVTFCLCLTKSFNKSVGKIDGCISFNSDLNITCKEREDQKSILEENLFYQYISSFVVLLIQISITTSTFLTEMKIFSTEHRNKWYSTGSYFWTKTIVEWIPTFLLSLCHAFIVYYISGQFEDGLRFYKYLFVTTAALLCTQSLGSSIGIIFCKNNRLALVIAIGTLSLLAFYNNFIIPTKNLNQFSQVLSDFTYTKYLFNSMLITIYGFGRCPSGQTSKVLYQFHINDDQIFWKNCIYLIYNYLLLKSLELIVVFIKANNIRIRSLKIFTIVKELKNCETQIQVISEKANQEYHSQPMEQVLSLNQNKCENCLESNDRKMMITWIDLTFTIPSNLFRKENKILDNISGCIELGSLNALMGPSGAGKTTLLRCLNGRIDSGLSEETKIYLSSTQTIKSCFITQNTCEHLLNGLTVKQTLLYASKLKNSNNNSKLSHENNINQLLLELMISDISNTNVEKCSGGQQKRLVIALELTSIIKPNLLCIDEPTSGLDSDAAQVVIECLKTLTRNHRMSIITSIHQPNNDLFMMFDNIYVLAKGGVSVYSGQPKDLKTHLNECNITCNEFQVPIEVLLKISSNGSMDERVKQLSTISSKSKETFICNNEMYLSTDGIKVKSKRFKVKDFWYLLLRTMTYTYIYEWKSLIMQLIVCLSLAFSLRSSYISDISKPDGCLDFDFSFNGNCSETDEKLEEESLLLQNIKYNISVFTAVTFLQIIITTLTFSTNIKIFINEHRNGWYNTGSYYWAKSTVDVIPVVIIFIIYCWIINLYDSIAIYFGYLYFITFGVLCSQSLGHFSGIIFNSVQKTALLFSVGIHLLMTIVGNCLVPIKEFHYSLQWLSELSFLKLAFESLLIMIYGFDRCYEKFSIILYRHDIEDEKFWSNSRNLLILLIVLKLLSLISLIIKTNSFSRRGKSNNLQISAKDSLSKLNCSIPGFS